MLKNLKEKITGPYKRMFHLFLVITSGVNLAEITPELRPQRHDPLVLMVTIIFLLIITFS
ncbi:MAG: hypothetical protein ABSB95_05785 [Dissulfurispiraceae bacterium]|jgi:hypothetical protein